MKHAETLLPRTLAVIVLLISLSMLIPLTRAVLAVIHGATRRLSAVRWGIASQIIWAWVLTIPAAAIIGACAFWAARIFGAQ